MLIGIMYTVYMFIHGVTVPISVNNSRISISTNSLVLFNENMLNFSLKISNKINMKYTFFCSN